MRISAQILISLILPAWALCQSVFFGQNMTTATGSCLPGYAHCRLLTVLAAQMGGSNQTNFPVATKVGSVVMNLGAGKIQNANCYDVVVTATQTATIVPFGLKACNQSTGDVLLYFPCASCSASVDNLFYVQYDNASISSPQNTGANAFSNVWDASTAGVWLLGDGTTLSLADSTSNGNTGTNNGVTATAGQVDGAGIFVSASSQYINLGTGSSLNITGAFTVSAWVNPTTLGQAGSNPTFVVAKDTNTGGARPYAFGVSAAGRVYIQRAGTGVLPNGSGANLTTGAWQFIAVTIDSTGHYNAYLNGVSNGTQFAGSTLPSDTTTNTDIGRRDYSGFQEYWNGLISDVMLASTNRSAAWLVAMYNNGAGTLLTVGPEI